MSSERISLIDAFDDCINRLNRGENIATCLQVYPQYRDQLYPMLETAQAARRGLRVNSAESQAAKERIRLKVEVATQLQNINRRRKRGIGRSMLFAAASILVLFIGLSLIAENSLPGDALFSLKLVNESLRLSFNPDLEAEFEQRRIEEIERLMEQGRVVEVAFVGTVETRETNIARIEGLTVNLAGATEGTELAQPGQRVQVTGQTQPNNTVLASYVSKPDDAGDEISLTPTPTLSFTETPTFTATATLTETPINTSTEAITATATTTPTATASITMTSTQTATRTASSTPTATVTPAVTTTGCVPVQPAGWVIYFVRSGDTLSGLAAATDSTIAQLINVNCIDNPRLLINGQQLYLPSLPVTSDTGSDGGDNSGGGDDNGGDDNGDDNDDNDDNGDDDNGGDDD